jgi:hypothetical protein
VKETATFFTTTVLPDVLDRHSAGFKSAAMVRLMHSMVRFNVLSNGDTWDVKTYGIPIPQVDQMPVGFFSIFPLAQKALREGRTSFTPVERARVEIGRYRCFLLGLPEDLLPTTPQGIVDILLTRHATLRKETDANCLALVRATMTADLTMGQSLRARAHAWLERGFSRVLYLAKFAHGDKRAAAAVGVQVGFSDYVAAVATGILTSSQMTIYGVAARMPGIDDIADRSLIRKLANWQTTGTLSSLRTPRRTMLLAPNIGATLRPSKIAKLTHETAGVLECDLEASDRQPLRGKP